jgi:hypothetical protein
MRHNRAIKKLITRLGGFRSFLDKDETSLEGQDESHKDEHTDDEKDALE